MEHFSICNIEINYLFLRFNVSFKKIQLPINQCMSYCCGLNSKLKILQEFMHAIFFFSEYIFCWLIGDKGERFYGTKSLYHSAVNWCIDRSLCDKSAKIGTNDRQHVQSTGLKKYPLSIQDGRKKSNMDATKFSFLTFSSHEFQKVIGFKDN